MVGRALQGLSSALLVPSSLGLVNTAYPIEERGRAVGLWSSYSAVAGGVGPLIAGVLLAITSWRYLFWINVPMVVLVWYLLGRSTVLGHETHSRQFDWHGAGYSILTLGLLTFAAIQSSTLGITHPIVLSLFGAAAVLAHQFLRRQKSAENPLIPPGIFRSRNFMAANVVTFLAYSSIGGGFYVMMLTWIQIQGYSPLAAGTITLPFMLFTAGFAHPIARLVRRIGARLPLSIGVMLLGVGFVIFAIPDVGTSFWLGYFPGVIASAAGIALLVAPVTTVIMGSVDPSQSGIASGINSAIARSAILLSVAVLGAIHITQFEQAAIAGLAALDLPAALANHMHSELINVAAAEIPSSATPEVREAIRNVIVDAFMSAARVAILIAAALSLCGGIIAFFAIAPLQKNDGHA
ncbi:MAG: hypothetical protein ACI9BW_004528 [Gammaproteobacteria bacterium]